MAPRKRAAKRARKATAREGSSAAPQAKIEFDRHRFRCEEHQRHFQVIEDWFFLKEKGSN